MDEPRPVTETQRIKIAPILRWTLAIFIICLFLAFLCACTTIHGGVDIGGSLGVFYQVVGAVSLVLFLFLLGLFIVLWVIFQRNIQEKIKDYAFQWSSKDSWSEFLTRCLQSNLVREERSYVGYRPSQQSEIEMTSVGRRA